MIKLNIFNAIRFLFYLLLVIFTGCEQQTSSHSTLFTDEVSELNNNKIESLKSKVNLQEKPSLPVLSQSEPLAPVAESIAVKQSADNICTQVSIIHCVAQRGDPRREFGNIQAAVRYAVAGDQVWVYAGRYDGFTVVEKAGTSDAKVLSIVAKEKGVIIDRPVRFHGREIGILVANTDYVTIEGFTVNYQNSDAKSYGIAAREAYAYDPMEGVVFRNNSVQNAGKNGLYMSNVYKGVIEGNEVFKNGEHGIYIANAGCDEISILNNNIHHNTNAGIHYNGDSSEGADGLQKGHRIAGNTINNNGQNGMNMDGVQDVLIQNNKIYANARNAIRAYSIDGAEGPKNYTIKNNTLIGGTGSEAIKFSQDLGGHTIVQNKNRL